MSIIERSAYWHLPDKEKGDLWSKVIAEGLNITEAEAKSRISRNNQLPVREKVHIYGSENFLDGTRSVYFDGEDEIVYPRFNANAVLLAQASPFAEGPRGGRPSLASAANILRISNIPQRLTIYYGMKLKEIAGGISKYLVDLGITGSNPETAPKGTKFSDDDIKSGIYISPDIDKPTACALGIIYGIGNISGGENLLLSSTTDDLTFLEGPVRKVFEEAFNFKPNQNIIRVRKEKTVVAPNGYDSLCVSFSSEALRTYLISSLRFPISRAERRQKGIAGKVKMLGFNPLDLQCQDGFLKYYIGSAAAFDEKDALTRFSDISLPFLKDLREMLRSRVTKESISLRDQGMTNNYILSLSTIPSMELYLQGYFDANPKLREKAKNYYEKNLGLRAAKYLERAYGNKIAPLPSRTRNF